LSYGRTTLLAGASGREAITDRCKSKEESWTARNASVNSGASFQLAIFIVIRKLEACATLRARHA